MKVLDLQCPQGHAFEGWFASEDDYLGQRQRQLLACPLCGATDVTKLPSAPRLNLGRAGQADQPPDRGGRADDTAGASTAPAAPVPHSPASPEGRRALQAAMLRAMRRLVAETEDVGARFAEEARRIHYGEAPGRGIRGQATPAQTAELLEEGIPVLPLPLPPGLKETLQ